MTMRFLNRMSLKQRVYVASIPILVGILVLQLRRPDQTDSMDEPATAGVSAVESKRSSGNDSADLRSASSHSQWPVFGRVTETPFNPFSRDILFPKTNVTSRNSSDVAGAAPQLVSTKVTSSAEALGPVRAVYQSGSSTVALVGDRLIKVGDRLEDGSVVLEITTEKIVLSNPSVH